MVGNAGICGNCPLGVIWLGTAGLLDARMRYGLKGEPVVADVDNTPVPVNDHSEMTICSVLTIILPNDAGPHFM